VFVPRDVVFEELEREPRLARRIIAALARRLHHLVRDLEAHSMHTGKQRLIGYLLHDCQWSRGADGTAEIVLPASKGTIASRLNLTQ
jgi:CRP-like cAMP-binding protein